LSAVVEAVRRHAGVARAELVGLAPRAALEGFPADVPLVGFDDGVHIIENALGL
jgi:glutamate formiminotransferase